MMNSYESFLWGDRHYLCGRKEEAADASQRTAEKVFGQSFFVHLLIATVMHDVIHALICLVSEYLNALLAGTDAHRTPLTRTGDVVSKRRVADAPPCQGRPRRRQGEERYWWTDGTGVDEEPVEEVVSDSSRLEIGVGGHAMNCLLGHFGETVAWCCKFWLCCLTSWKCW